MSEKKYRIYELAKDYGVTSKDVMGVLEAHKIEFKNHTSTVNESAKEIVDALLRPGKGGQVKVVPSEPVEAVEAVAAVKIDVKKEEPKVAETPKVATPVVEKVVVSEPVKTDVKPAPVAPAAPVEPKPVVEKPKVAAPVQQARPAGPSKAPLGGGPFRPAPGHQVGASKAPLGGGPFRPAPGHQVGASKAPLGGGPFRPAPGHQVGASKAPLGGGPFRPATPQGQRPPYQGQGQQRPGGFKPAGTGAGRPAFAGASSSQGRPAGPNKPVGSTPPPSTIGADNNRFKKKVKDKDREKRWKDGDARLSASKNGKHQFQKPVELKAPKVKPEKIAVGPFISVTEFADKAGLATNEVIKKLLLLGIMATINQEIDFDTASLVASDFDIAVEELVPELEATEIEDVEDAPEDLLPRPPVVTIMGHVDHGKTSLLDTIRHTNVTAREAGGITQHIGAYQISAKGKKITFLDTPGHEAFTAMRARGAQATDIAVLVVAANDGVMPQTIEAINHAKSAKVPIIVAINKIDIPDANPDRVKQQLSDHGLLAEDWGGDTIMVPVSAKQKLNIDDLLDHILLVAEIEDLKANPNRPAQGIVIEANLDKGRGPVATILIQKGTLRVGDSIVVGVASGKVRALINDRGESVKKAEPSVPVEVLGLSEVPEAGDNATVADEKVVRAVAAKRQVKKRTEEMQHNQKVSLEDIFQQIQDGQIKDLNIVIKGDVQGSIEALRQSLETLKNKEVRVNVVHSGVGAINESDVMLASAANAIILGFNVRPDGNARKAAESEKVDLRTYRVIYEAIQDIEQALEGMLAPEFKEVVYGHAEVRQVISIPKGGVVAGSYVQDGKITNKSQMRITRGGIVIHEGTIDSLRRFKDEVKEVATGYECGISIERFRDIKEGDVFEAFGMEEIKRGS